MSLCDAIFIKAVKVSYSMQCQGQVSFFTGVEGLYHVFKPQVTGGWFQFFFVNEVIGSKFCPWVPVSTKNTGENF